MISNDEYNTISMAVKFGASFNDIKLQCYNTIVIDKYSMHIFAITESLIHIRYQINIFIPT